MLYLTGNPILTAELHREGQFLPSSPWPDYHQDGNQVIMFNISSQISQGARDSVTMLAGAELEAVGHQPSLPRVSVVRRRELQVHEYVK